MMASLPCALGALLVAPLFLAAQPLSFEVASIKSNRSGSGSSSDRTSPGRFTAVNVSAHYLVELAFRVKPFQVSGGPGWLNSENWDISATTGSSKEMNS